jgi:hypothetical protein
MKMERNIGTKIAKSPSELKVVSIGRISATSMTQRELARLLAAEIAGAFLFFPLLLALIFGFFSL